MERRDGRSSENFFDLDALVSTFQAFLFLFDEADRFVDYRAGPGLFVPPESFLGRRVDEVMPPESGPRTAEALALARRTRKLVSLDYSLPMRDGERHFEARLQALPDGRVAALCTDVTERRQAEEDVRRRRTQLDHLLALSPSVIYSLAIQGNGARLAAMSENVERILGCRADELADPAVWIEKVHPDDRAGAAAAGARVLAEGRVVQHYRFRHRDGGWRWIRDELQLVRDGSGRPAEVVGSLSDVTAQRQAEERLRETEERFRALIERSTDLVIVLDERGTVTFASPSSTDVLGFTPEELLGTGHLGHVHPDDASRVAEAFLALREQPGASRRIELRVRHRDGRWRQLQAEARNLLHVPAVRGLVTNSRDITEQRRFEEQYLQAQKLEGVGRLAGGVAHDFNNLLVGILGYADFLEEGIRAGNPSMEDLEEIRRAGERARDLTRQLLAVARRQVVRPLVIDLNQVLRDAEKLLRRVVGEDIDLAVATADGLWRVKADPAQLQQVVLNLAVNARDAMPHGGKLTLETANADLDGEYAATHPGVQPGQYAMLAVSDSGVGLSAEAKAHLFEPFFTTKPSGAGTGLGLATVYGIVKQAGGHVSAYSEPERGTCFKIYLPRTAEAPAGEPTAPAPPIRRGWETVLVVEDEPRVRELAARALAEAGYRVLQAATGGEALALAAGMDQPIHLLVTDVVMPDTGGKQLADGLRASRPGLRVLYVSGYTQDAVVHEGVLDAGVHFLPKPFTPRTLQEKVRAVLDGA